MKKLLAFVTVATLGAAACASGTDTGGSTSDESAITITMVDSRFEPAKLTIDKGEELTFEFKNEGAVPHDAFIGDKQGQMAHEREMRMQNENSDEMQETHGGHGMTDEGGITVQPGKTGTLQHRFTEAGTYYIGCHQKGHYEGGMRVKLTVS
jgi:uncharacterized cupredoxin-like copper-binding protein